MHDDNDAGESNSDDECKQDAVSADSLRRLEELVKQRAQGRLKVGIFNVDKDPDSMNLCISTPAVPSFFTTPLPRIVQEDPIFHVAEDPRKGLCMYASRDIARGDTILSERPLFVVHSELEEDLAVLASIVDEVLPDKLQSTIYGLDVAPAPGQDILQAILQGNAHSVSIAREKHSALFAQSSRISHSCCPNAVHHFDERQMMYTLVAQKDLSAGQEVTISYYPLDVLLLSRAERQQAIFAHRIFSCLCEACEVPEQSSIHDDHFRGLILDRSQALYTLETPSDLGQIQELLDLHTELSLETGKASLCSLALDRCRRERYPAAVCIKWAQLAATELSLRYGHNSRQAQDAFDYMEEVTAYLDTTATKHTPELHRTPSSLCTTR
jgi:hypothetical protein